MSFNTHMSCTNQLPANCYREDSENYDEEYCENDVIDENQNVFPLTNENIANTQVNTKQVSNYSQPVRLSKKNQQYGMSQNVFPQCCYVRKLPPSTHVAIPYENYHHQPQYYGMHQCCPLSSISQQDTTYDSLGYRTNLHHDVAPHYSYRNIQSAERNQAYQKPVHSKKYMVTAPTPKYYRKLASASVYKRPSALCLPVASQPDPAVYRRSRKQISNESSFEIQEAMLRTIDSPNMAVKQSGNTTDTVHKPDSEGDATFKVANLEQMLEHLEIQSPVDIVKNKADLAKISKFFKPKLPPSLKNKEEQSTTNQTENTTESENASKPSPEVYDKSKDSLDKLLQQLKKCEMPSSNEEIENNSVYEFQSYQGRNETGGSDNPESVETSNRINEPDKEGQRKRNVKDLKSFNYQDITDQMTRTQEEMKGCSDSAMESTSSIQEITKRLSSVSSSSGKPRSLIPKPTLDDHCALELHRSKSYIVNLIDRALSKELGTVPSERNKKEFVSV